MDRSRWVMWLKLLGLAAATIAVLVLLFGQTGTYEITVDMPRSPADGRPSVISTQTFERTFEWIAAVGSGVVLVAIGALVFWLGRRIVRQHTTPPSA